MPPQGGNEERQVAPDLSEPDLLQWLFLFYISTFYGRDL